MTVELTNGEVYRGLVVNTEDNMNVQLQNVTMWEKNGEKKKLEHIFIRGSKIRFVILPGMLQEAPMFSRFDPKSKKKVGAGAGAGRAGKGAGRQ